ncbi:MAG: FecR domain-containing protein [Pseudomonadota bacterium]
MSKVRSIRSREQRLEEASDWIARLDRTLTEDEEKRLEEWLRADPRNEETLSTVLRVWNKAESLGRLSALFPKPVTRSGRDQPLLWAAAAAVTVVTVLSAAWVFSNDAAQPLENSAPPLVADRNPRVFETAIGEREDVTLPDGSIVTLNTNSLLEIAFDQEQRRNVLHRGEASFTVAHDPDRPFAVHASDNVVTAVGTVFHLEITNDDHVELVVTDGKVIVDTPLAQRPSPSTAAPILVSAGEEATLGDARPVVRPIDPGDVQLRLSWHQDKLVFRGETMEQVEHEIRRYTNIEFVYLDDSIRQESVGGLVLDGDVNGFLKGLDASFDIQYQHIGESRVLLSRK